MRCGTGEFCTTWACANCNLGVGLRERGGRGVDLLLRRGRLGQAALALEVGLRLGQRGLGARELRLRLLQQRGKILARDFGQQGSALLLLAHGVERALRGFAIDFVLTPIDVDQRLALV